MSALATSRSDFQRLPAARRCRDRGARRRHRACAGCHAPGHLRRRLSLAPRLRRCRANFPVLARAAGRDGLRRRWPRDYVRAHDSTFFSIRYYGDELARFPGHRSGVLEGARSWPSWRAGNGRWRRCSTLPMPSRSTSSAFAQRGAGGLGGAAVRVAPVACSALDARTGMCRRSGRRVTRRRGAAGAELPRRAGAVAAVAAGAADLLPLAARRARPRRSMPRASGSSFGELCVLLCDHLGESAGAAAGGRLPARLGRIRVADRGRAERPCQRSARAALRRSPRLAATIVGTHVHATDLTTTCWR